MINPKAQSTHGVGVGPIRSAATTRQNPNQQQDQVAQVYRKPSMVDCFANPPYASCLSAVRA
ncbi:MAG: hypothetical protein ACKN9F_02095 [Methylomonas sp.]